ncbi:unnamed protein product [Arabidopsis thaliana]|uniref:(thale cress) hypothetical protein n=1 Tax=Arabidopsis thaliana TaxID=3702 RepID=A0A7G2EY56_ARATH|nr:unnamed protein product [Arabidopsis thaliana]
MKEEEFPKWVKSGSSLVKRRTASNNRQTVNHGIVVRTMDEEYYGVIEDILDVEYPRLIKCVLFKFDQVCYIPYLRVKRIHDPWITATQINPRGRVDGVKDHDPMQQNYVDYVVMTMQRNLKILTIQVGQATHQILMIMKVLGGDGASTSISGYDSLNRVRRPSFINQTPLSFDLLKSAIYWCDFLISVGFCCVLKHSAGITPSFQFDGWNCSKDLALHFKKEVQVKKGKKFGYGSILVADPTVDASPNYEEMYLGTQEKLQKSDQVIEGMLLKFKDVDFWITMMQNKFANEVPPSMRTTMYTNGCL